MFSIDVKVGRLLEVRMVAPITMEDLQGVGRQVQALFLKHPGKLVSATDATRAAIVPPDVSHQVIEVFKMDNPRVERSGFLINQSAIFGLQIERLVAAAQNPSRRCFRDPFEMKAFLGSLLTHEEHGRLAQFLSER